MISMKKYGIFKKYLEFLNFKVLTHYNLVLSRFALSLKTI